MPIMSQTKRIPRWIVSASCSLMLALLLAACSLGGQTTTTPTPTPVPTSPPSPAPSLIATSASGSLITYTGDGYTIGYPQGWKVNKGNNGVVTFTDPQGIAYLNVKVTPNPNGIVPAATQVGVALQLFKSQAKNYQKVDIAPTTMVGGDTWSQGSATGDIVPQGQTSPVTAKIVVIADNHPATSPNTNSFTIAYLTAKQVFDLANTGFFQPMLQSFKFSS